MNVSHPLVSSQARSSSLTDSVQKVAPGSKISALDLGPHALPDKPLQILFLISEEDFPEDVEALDESFGRHQLNAGILLLDDIEGDDLKGMQSDLEEKIAQLHKGGRIDNSTIVFISMHGDYDEVAVVNEDLSTEENSEAVDKKGNSSATETKPYSLSAVDGQLNVEIPWLMSRLRNTAGDGAPFKGQIHLTACGAKQGLGQVADDGFSYTFYGGNKAVSTTDALITCMAVVDLLGHCHRERMEFPLPEKIAEHAAAISGATVSVKKSGQLISFSTLKSTPKLVFSDKTVKKNETSRGERLLLEKLAHGSARSVKKTFEKFGSTLWPRQGMDVALLAIESNRDVMKKLRVLASNDWDFDVQDSDGETLLHLAADYAHAELVEFCIEEQMNVNVKNNDNKTPIFYAVLEGSAKVVSALIEAGANINRSISNTGMDALHMAVMNNHIDVAKVILCSPSVKNNVFNKDGKTAIHLATEQKNSRMISLLAANGANVDTLDQDGQTALCSAIKSGDPRMVKALLDAGADVSLTVGQGHSPLMLAVMKSDAGYMARQLIYKDADVNARDNSGLTPLHFAAKEGNIETVKILLQAGANQIARSVNSETPLDIARRYQQPAVVKFLSALG